MKLDPVIIRGKERGFAFVPIVAKSDDIEETTSLRIAASLAIRDILPLIAKLI